MPDQENVTNEVVEENTYTDEQVDDLRDEVEELRRQKDEINANTLEVARSRENQITYTKLENEKRVLQAEVNALLSAGGVQPEPLVVDPTAPAGVPSANNPAAPTAPVSTKNADPSAQQEAQDAANADGNTK